MRIPAALFAAAPLCITLAGCATTGTGGRPAEVIRYHLDQPIERGTVVIQPAVSGTELSTEVYAAAVSRSLSENGYQPAAPGGGVDYIATIEVGHRPDAAPRRSSGFSFGIGAGGFSGGRRGGGVGYGGGVSIPVGGARHGSADGTELSVTIKRRVDQSPVWEGHARTVADRGVPEGAVAQKLATALFTGFPGESGRTITVR